MMKVLPGAGGILPSVQPGSKLAAGLQEVNVVTANEGLGQVDDSGHQTRLYSE